MQEASKTMMKFCYVRFAITQNYSCKKTLIFYSNRFLRGTKNVLLTKLAPFSDSVANGLANVRKPCFRRFQVSIPPVAQDDEPC